jgi:hypothetical protein
MLAQVTPQRTIPQEVKRQARPHARAYFAWLDSAADFESAGRIVEAQGCRERAATARATAWALIAPYLAN